jgi:cell division protein FtsL
MGQLNTKLIDLNSQVTDLQEQEKIITSETTSILSSIKSLLSMENLNKIAKEKNFTKNKGRIVVLKLENDQTEEK